MRGCDARSGRYTGRWLVERRVGTDPEHWTLTMSLNTEWFATDVAKSLMEAHPGEMYRVRHDVDPNAVAPRQEETK